jgi:hypothetical protein
LKAGEFGNILLGWNHFFIFLVAQRYNKKTEFFLPCRTAQ